MDIFFGTIFVVLVALAFYTFRILREYERGVVFMLGRFYKVKGPGLVIIIPVIQQMVRVDLRTIVADIPTQAEEASAIDRPVGAFSQLCQKHTLLEHNAYYFKGTIEGTEGAPRSANDVISAWSIGADISLIDTPLGSTSVCPDN